jgi:hypothetical protein
MSASVTGKKQCVTCNKTGGILTCDGCEQIFCGKHVIEHRQELGGQLDDIIQEHYLLQDELGEPTSKKNFLLKKIDRWEQDSIEKIQAAADTARTDLEKLIEQSKERISKTCLEITQKLRSYREDDDFSEIDLDRWKKQLHELKLEITTPSGVKLIPDKNAPIYPMVITANDLSNDEFASSNKPPPTKSSPKPDLQERFLQILGPVNLDEGGYLAKHTGTTADCAYIRGRLLYSEGCHTVRFKIEKCKSPYRIFFGCMSSRTPLKEDAFFSPTSVGWFGSNQVYENGRRSISSRKNEYNSSKIQTDDVLHLTLDCTTTQLRLFHERLKTTCILSVNHNSSPFPWQLLMVLCNSGDTVRILPYS